MPQTLREAITQARESGKKVRIYFTEDLDSEIPSGKVDELMNTEVGDDVQVKVAGIVEALKTGLEEAAKSGKGVLTRIEAIHAGLTRNLTYYSEENLRNSAASWTKPYQKPVLTHHNKYGEPVGRVKEARYNNQSMLSAGRGCIELLCEITDPEAKSKLTDGRYSTVSIGAETDSIKCSICGTDILNEGWCDHEKGERYNSEGKPDSTGQLCYWQVGNLNFDEVSFVNIPSDPFAMATGILESTTDNRQGDPEGVSESAKAEGTLNESTAPDNLESNQEGANVTMPNGLPESLVMSEEVKALFEASGEALRNYITAALQAVADAIAQQTESAQQIETLTQEKSQLESEKNEATEKLTASETRVSELEGQVAEMTTERESHTAEAAQWQSEREQLLAENARVAEEWRTSLIERIVEGRIALGKDKAEDKDAVVERLSSRPVEYLIFCLQDLAEEHPNLTGLEQVHNPGLVKDVDEAQTQTTGAKDKKEVTYEDLAEATAGLFRGPGLSIKKSKK
jgi:hypothetical protein